MTTSDAAFFKRAIARRMTSLPATFRGRPFTAADTEALKARVLVMLESKTAKHPMRPARQKAPEENTNAD
jgi:hypothetical protein